MDVEKWVLELPTGYNTHYDGFCKEIGWCLMTREGRIKDCGFLGGKINEYYIQNINTLPLYEKGFPCFIILDSSEQMLISYERSLEENINEGIKTLEYHISSQNYPIVNEMFQLQIETLQWVLNKQKQENSLESLKQIIDFKVKRLEYEWKKIARRDIEYTTKIVYQLEMLECCKIIINWELQRRTKTTTKEDDISAFC